MTYWSSAAQIVFGLGMKPVFCFFVPAERLSSSRTSWQRSMHWSQMKTPGPATSLRTWSCPLPQNEQRVYLRRSSLSFIGPSSRCSARVYQDEAGAGGLWPHSISFATLMHSLQMKTPEPATSLTPNSPCIFPQNEHFGLCLLTSPLFPLRRKIMGGRSKGAPLRGGHHLLFFL